MQTLYDFVRPVALVIALTGMLNLVPVRVHSLSSNDNKAPAKRQDLARVKESYARIPLSFVPNHGQADQQVKFTSRGSGYSLALAPTSFTLASSSAVLRATLLGGNKAARLTGLERLITKTNFFTGHNPRMWKTNIPNYAKVKYSRVYPGIDLVFYGNQNLIEYDFIVAPGANPDLIALKFEGATGLRVDQQGDLLLRTQGGEVRQSRPIVYQQINGAKKIIPASYVIKDNRRISFEIANYDRSKPLVIDPTLAFSTYLGGSDIDAATAIAVDASGNAYITGRTVSADFPITPGAFQQEKASLDFDVFITKMNSSGTALSYSTYFGGGNRESSSDIALDEAGNAYVTGLTDSSDIPTTPGAFRTTPVGTDEFDAFAMKLNATGTALVYSTYLGPVNGAGIAVDSGGNAFIVGGANGDYPTTPGALQTVYGGGGDAFVTKLNPTGTALVYSTLLGGTAFDTATAVAIDADGNAYVSGITGAGFPVTPGAFQTTFNGNTDGFVTKLNATGTTAVYSTYLGGSESDILSGIAVNASGNAYVTGFTSSSNFPTTPGAFQTNKAAGSDAFVTQLNVTGTALAYSTFLGGDANDFGNGIAVDADGNASIAGQTGSTNFPTTTDAIQSALAGNDDAFITRLNATGTALVFSTYLGGANTDAASAIWLDSAGSIYVAGQTSSDNFPTTPGAFDTMYGGNTDAFVSKIVFSNFDVCFTDDGNGSSFQFDSTTGAYSFTQNDVTITGTGTVSRQGCLLVLEDNQSGQRVKAQINECNNTAQAVIQLESGKKQTFVITDKDSSNSNCP